MGVSDVRASSRTVCFRRTFSTWSCPRESAPRTVTRSRLRVRRLLEEVDRAELRRLDGRLDRPVARDHHDRDRALGVVERLEDLHAVALRHLDVEQHEVDAAGLRACERPRRRRPPPRRCSPRTRGSRGARAGCAGSSSAIRTVGMGAGRREAQSSAPAEAPLLYGARRGGHAGREGERRPQPASPSSRAAGRAGCGPSPSPWLWPPAVAMPISTCAVCASAVSA